MSSLETKQRIFVPEDIIPSLQMLASRIQDQSPGNGIATDITQAIIPWLEVQYNSTAPRVLLEKALWAINMLRTDTLADPMLQQIIEEHAVLIECLRFSVRNDLSATAQRILHLYDQRQLEVLSTYLHDIVSTPSLQELGLELVASLVRDDISAGLNYYLFEVASKEVKAHLRHPIFAYLFELFLQHPQEFAYQCIALSKLLNPTQRQRQIMEAAFLPIRTHHTGQFVLGKNQNFECSSGEEKMMSATQSSRTLIVTSKQNEPLMICKSLGKLALLTLCDFKTQRDLVPKHVWVQSVSIALSAQLSEAFDKGETHLCIESLSSSNPQHSVWVYLRGLHIEKLATNSPSYPQSNQEYCDYLMNQCDRSRS